MSTDSSFEELLSGMILSGYSRDRLVRQKSVGKNIKLNSRAHFQFVRRMAIVQSFEHIHRDLKIFLSGIVCFGTESERVETPYKMFSWSEQDFYKRRRIKNTAWIEVFMLQLTRDCLEKRKLQIDIKEIIKYTLLIYDKYRGMNVNVVEMLQSAHNCLGISDVLLNAFKENAKKEENFSTGYHAHRFKKDAEDQRSDMINKLEHVLFESDVFDPIEVRYQLRYYKEAVEDFQDRKLAEQNAIRKEIENIREQQRIDEYCSQCAVNALYAEISKYRQRIEYMSARYAKEYDEVDNDITYKRVNMDKMRAQRNYLEEQIVRFKEEIAHIKFLEFQEAEEARLEWERRQLRLSAKSVGKRGKQKKPKTKAKK